MKQKSCLNEKENFLEEFGVLLENWQNNIRLQISWPKQTMLCIELTRKLLGDLNLIYYDLSDCLLVDDSLGCDYERSEKIFRNRYWKDGHK